MIRPRALVIVLSVAGLSASPSQAVKPDARRIAAMHDNLAAVTAAQTGVVQGELATAQAAARKLLAVPVPTGLPDIATLHLNNMTTAARRLSEAPQITAAAAATATMLAACGACHRAVGTAPALPAIQRPAVGGTVGHMLDHQRAVDQMLEGLVMPSNAAWLQGARSLRASPLHARELPRDNKLTPELLRVEEAVHKLAEEAVGAETTDGRARVFGTLLARCADCHGLHRRVWGPPIAPASGVAAASQQWYGDAGRQ